MSAAPARQAPGSTQRRVPRLHLILLCGVLLLIASCAPPQAPVVALPSAAPSMVALAAPTGTALAEPSPAAPTATGTATAAPTATSTATAAPTVTATATLTPTALVVLPTPTLPELDAAQRAKLFADVWGSVAQHYLYPDFGGVDWDALKAEYEPRALAAASSADFYAVLGEMVTRLGDQHSRYLDPQRAYAEHGLTTGEVYVGIGVLTIDDPAGRLVTTVFPNTPASAAGIRRRDIIVAVDGQPLDQSGSQIAGPEGSVARLQVRSPSGAQRAVEVERRAVLEQYVPDVYMLPSTDVGYVLVQSFWPMDTPQQVEDALRRFLEQNQGRVRGLIVDVRSNGGGWRTVLEGLLGNFVAGNVGSFYSQSTSYALEVTPGPLREQLKALPVVVLVDRDTKSYAEVFAAVLQSQGRAQVVGVNTAGNTETIYAYDFEDGSRLWVAQEGFKLPDGQSLEGRGVVPDRSIPVDWLQFSEVKDPHIAKGIELLHAQAGSN